MTIRPSYLWIGQTVKQRELRGLSVRQRPELVFAMSLPARYLDAVRE
jgi:hypothetical protein